MRVIVVLDTCCEDKCHLTIDSVPPTTLVSQQLNFTYNFKMPFEKSLSPSQGNIMEWRTQFYGKEFFLFVDAIIVSNV